MLKYLYIYIGCNYAVICVNLSTLLIGYVQLRKLFIVRVYNYQLNIDRVKINVDTTV